MKKLINLLLILCLLCGTAALADSTITNTGANSASTTVTYTVSENYFVTIPASVTIDSANGTGAMTLGIGATSLLGSGKQVRVSVSAAADAYEASTQKFLLKSGEASLKYKIQRTDGLNTYTYGQNGDVAIWTQDNLGEDYVLALNADTAAVAGTYTGMLTFTVVYENTPVDPDTSEDG